MFGSFTEPFNFNVRRPASRSRTMTYLGLSAATVVM